MSASKNLLYIVEQVKQELEDYTTHVNYRLLQLAFKGYRELKFFALPSIKVAYLAPDAINCVQFPSDYMQYTKIGINIHGRIYTLTRNDDISLTRQTDGCGVDIRDINADANGTLFDWGYSFAPHYYGGNYLPTLYGLGGGLNGRGYYRIDEEMERIQLDNILPQTQIVLEYISNGVEPDGSSIVPAYAINCLGAYVHWQNIEHNLQIPDSKKARKFEQYDIEFSKMNDIKSPFRIDEYLDEKWSHARATINR